MKNITKIMSLCAAAALTSTAFAGDVEEMKKLLEDQGIKPNYVETKLPSVRLSGYVDTSYVYNTSGGGTSANSPAFATGAAGAPSRNAVRSFDTDSNDFSVNAVKLALEKPLSAQNEWTAGFRIDTIYGEDAKYLGGNDPANAELALEQAYVTFRIPVGNGLDFKVGKFVTLLGYEVIESPANANFSRGLLFTYAIPLTHTGAVASYTFNDIVDMQFGIVNGWNNEDSVFPAVGAAGGRTFKKAITGRINITNPGKNANIAQSFIISPTGENSGSFATGNSEVWVYDIWGNWSPKAIEKLLLGFNVDVGQQDGASFGLPDGGERDALFYGAALYAKYQFTPKFSLAGRLEYFVDESGIRTGWASNPLTTAGGSTRDAEILSYTLTAGFDLWENMIARLEYRYDVASEKIFDRTAAGAGPGKGDQHTIGVNFVYSF